MGRQGQERQGALEGLPEWPEAPLGLPFFVLSPSPRCHPGHETLRCCVPSSEVWGPQTELSQRVQSPSLGKLC